MGSNYDIEMSSDDTLELDTIIKESNIASDPINDLTYYGDSSYSENILKNFETHTTVFDPPESGEYDINVNGQVLSINVTDASTIPDSVVEQWTAEGYDSNNEVIEGQIGGIGDLTGGSASKETDGNGNIAIRYTGDSEQKHTTNGTLTYSNYVHAIVLNLNDGGGVVVRDASADLSVQSDLDSNRTIDFGNNYLDGGTPPSNIELIIALGENFNNKDEIQVDGSSVKTGEAGDKDWSGFQLGNDMNDAYIYEWVMYQDPTQTELSNERDRLKGKYNGLSF